MVTTAIEKEITIVDTKQPFLRCVNIPHIHLCKITLTLIGDYSNDDCDFIQDQVVMQEDWSLAMLATSLIDELSSQHKVAKVSLRLDNSTVVEVTNEKVFSDNCCIF